MASGDIKRLKKPRKNGGCLSAVSGLKGNFYEDKLSELGMSTLAAKREILDPLYKIISNKVDLNSGGLNLVQPRARLDLIFSVRVVETWNSLPVSTKSARSE